MAEGSGLLDPTNLSFAFGAGTGTPSYLELDRRRAIAQALAQQKRGFPKNIGEGITALGEAVGDRFADARMTQQERALAASEAAAGNRVRGLPGVGSATPSTIAPVRGASVPVPGPATVPASPPVPKTPLTPAVPAVPSPTADLRNPGEMVRDRIAALYSGGESGAGGPPPNPTVAAENPPQAQSVASFPEATASGDAGDAGGIVPARRAAIGGIESGGRKDPYNTIGVQTRYGRALGRYGVTEANVGPWSQAALGQALTPQQFLGNKAAQDAVFDHRFGLYVNRFGEEGAARAWYGGPGNINRPELKDVHERLSIADYGQDYLRRLRSAAGDVPAAGSTPQPGALPGASPEAGIASAGQAGDAGQSDSVDNSYNVESDPGDGTNPPTPTTIRPMPRTGTTVTSDTAPSEAAIPPASRQTMEPPGTKPVPPERIDFSPRQRGWMEIMQNPHFSPLMRERAKMEYDQEEKIRTELTARREADYTYERGRWDKYKDEYDKFVREAPDRDIKQLSERLGIEKTQHDVRVMAPLERALKEAEVLRQPDVAEKLRQDIANAKADLEKKQYEITQRTLAERKAAAETVSAEQKAAAGVAPPHFTNDNNVVVWDQERKTWKIIEPEALPNKGGPPAVGNLTGEQAKALTLYGKAQLGLEHMARIPDGDRLLAEGLKQELLGKVPFFGNSLLESRYRAMRNAANSIVQAHLRDVSGAAFSASELTNTHNNLIPVYGDDARVMQQKAELRKSVAEGLYLGLGKARPLADYETSERTKAEAARQEKIASEMPPNPEIGKIYKKVDPKTKREIRRHWTGTRWEED